MKEILNAGPTSKMDVGGDKEMGVNGLPEGNPRIVGEYSMIFLRKLDLKGVIGGHKEREDHQGTGRTGRTGRTRGLVAEMAELDRMVKTQMVAAAEVDQVLCE